MPAPRKALNLKRKLEFSDEVREDVVHRLAAIRRKNAPKMLELSTAARKLLREMALIEDEAEMEALEAHNEYYDVAREFKLTFEPCSRREAENQDDLSPNLDTCYDYVKAVEEDAAAAVASAAAAADAAPVAAAAEAAAAASAPCGCCSCGRSC